MKVIGIRRIDITNDNGSFHGYKYYCTEEDPNVAGVIADSFTISDDVASSLPRDICIDDEVIPVYRRESKRIRTVIFDS